MVCGSPREVCQAPHVSSLSSSRHRPARVWQVILQFGWPNLSLKSETWEDLLPSQTRKNIEMILKNQRSRWKEIAHDDPTRPHCIKTLYSLLDLFKRVHGPLFRVFNRRKDFFPCLKPFPTETCPEQHLTNHGDIFWDMIHGYSWDNQQHVGFSKEIGMYNKP